MPGIAVLCWEENRPWVSSLRQKGFSVPWVEEPKGDAYRQMSTVEPELLLVDLTRLPEQGREIILDLADRGDLNGVPVVIVSDKSTAGRGLKSKVKKLSVTTPRKIISAVKTAMEGG